MTDRSRPSVAEAAIQVAVIDDHPLALRGITDIFRTDPHIRVVCAVASVEEFMTMTCHTDVVILDLYLAAGRSTRATIGMIAQRSPVLVMSASSMHADVVAAVMAGAGGYLTKQAEPAAFVEAVRIVATGGFYLSSQLADAVQHDAQRGRTAAGHLSSREQEALGYIAQGYTQAQTARRMGISPATVDTYVKRIRRKLHAGNKADLARRAAAIIDLDPPPGLDGVL